MTEPFCTITMSRGDRGQLLDFCKQQLSRMTIQPKETFFITHEPTSESIDLTLRLRLGIAAAEKAGIDVCYIIEDDDYYPAKYFEHMDMTGLDFIGSSETIYYNLNFKTYQEFKHPTRSSLCFTGFRVSAVRHFSWPPDDTVFLDMVMWRYAQRKRHKLIDMPVGLGIKHGIGKTAGVGHRMKLRSEDPNMEFLKLFVDSEAYAFYRTI